jgi:two-component system NtrC family sensor kinase
MGQEVTGYDLNPSEKAPYTDYVVRKDVAKNTRYFLEALKGRAQHFATTIVASDGHLVDVLINLTPIHKGSDIVGVLGIARDITERKQLQAQLMQAGKMAAIGELAAGVAHEINNPVGIISGAAEQLEFLLNHDFKQSKESSDRFLGHVEMIREQAERCSRITQGLLNFARKTEVRAASVDIAMLIKEAVTLLESRALTERKKIETDIAPNLPLVMADPHLLEQVFVNLANNALDALDKAGTVTIRVFVDDGEVAIEVADDGEGIDNEDMERIFDPFFTTKAPGRGTGLGLSICFGIVDQMNGTISVDSTPGVGTSFVVRIPFAAQERR